MRPQLVLALFVALGCCTGLRADENVADLKVVGGPEIVMNGDPCGNMAIPDSPARALRLTDGSTMLIAAHHMNSIMTGPSLLSLHMNCQVISKGNLNPNPDAFDDRFWVQALAPLPGRRILGISSHEYNGKRHEGMCQSAKPSDCWYGSLTLTVASENEFRFVPLPLDARVLAAPDRPYKSEGIGRRGFFSVSNILWRGDFAYMFAYLEHTDGVKRGNCLLRASRRDLLRWSIFHNGSFVPTETAQGCTPVGLEATSGPFRSVVYIEPLRRYATFVMRGAGEEEGVYVSLSDDLISWGASKLLLRAKTPYGKKDCAAYYYYPSAIDSASKSELFDTAGASFDLYMTRYNFENCKRDHRNRDLVRFSVQVD